LIPVTEGSQYFTALITLNVDATGANLTITALIGNQVTVTQPKPIVMGAFSDDFTVGTSQFALKGTFTSVTTVTGTWAWSKSSGTWQGSPKA
jgi:hypothetical protein